MEVHRFIRRVSFHPASDDPADVAACARLSASDITVRLAGGRRVTPRSLEYDRRPLLVAIVADISELTGGPAYYEELRKAVRRIREGLAAEDFVSVAVSSDGFWITVPPTPAGRFAPPPLPQRRQATFFDQQMESRDLEALLGLLRLLAAWPGRTALVYVGDGLTFPPGGVTASVDDLVELLESGGTVVSAVGKWMPGCPAGDMPGDAGPALLRHLARISGGRVTGSEHPRVSEILPALVRELHLRAEISFDVEARPDGRAPRVTGIGVRGGLPCRASIDRRSATAPRIRPAVRMAGGAPRRLDGVLRHLGLAGGPGPWIATASFLDLRSPVFGDEADQIEFYAVDRPGWLVAVGPAIMLDSGLITKVDDYLAGGEVTEGSRRTYRIERRPVAVRVPSPAVVEESLHSLADGLLMLADEGVRSAREWPDWPVVTAPFVIEGLTFLEWQPGLSEAIAARYPAWARHVRQLRERQIEAEARYLVDASGTGADPARLEVVRRLVRRRAERENRWPAWRLFGGLLGDVPLVDVHRELDRKLSQRLLDGLQRGVDPGPLRDELEDRWARITSWLPPVTGVRSLVPLVPVRDPVQGRIGFWRVVIPLRERHRGARLPEDFAPEAPLALRLLAQRVVDDPVLLRRIAGGRIREVRYSKAGRKVFCAAVELAGEDGAPGVSLSGCHRRTWRRNDGASFEIVPVEREAGLAGANGGSAPRH
ncbi:MAG: hypothetical protein D6738_00620 [Acidobacteria bacterium]|nr:MAG: hypothetical protein D6738_00620 [Acidobacteriota bacterium]